MIISSMKKKKKIKHANHDWTFLTRDPQCSFCSFLIYIKAFKRCFVGNIQPFISKIFYFLFIDPVFRTFDYEVKTAELLEKMKKIDCWSDEGMFKFSLAVLENTFFCHVRTNDKHSSLLFLENILNHIEGKFKITGSELISLAHSLRSDNEALKSLLYYQAASVLISRSTAEATRKMKGILSCILGLKRLVDIFVDTKKLSVVFNYILPLMNDLIQIIKSQNGADKDDKAKTLAWTTLFVALCHIRLDNWLEVQNKTKEAMGYMIDAFQNLAPRHWVFGACSDYYGRSFHKLGDNETAVEVLKKAVAYRKSAEDYKTADDKRTKIAMTSSILKSVQAKCTNKVVQTKDTKKWDQFVNDISSTIRKKFKVVSKSTLI